MAAAGVGDALGIKRLDIYASKDTECKINVKQNCYIFISSKGLQACAMYYSPNYGDLVLSMMFGDTNVFSATESSGHIFIKRANNELFLVNKKYDVLVFQLIVIEV